MKKSLVFAHRGASGYAPENTMASFKKALEMKADGIELDVHLTKDYKVVVCHDANIKRTSDGEGLIMDKTLEELYAFDFGSWFSADFKGERIPTLEEVLVLLSKRDTTLNIELKGTPGEMLPGIEKEVVELVRKYNMTDRIIISSFNHYSLVNLKKIAPEFKIGLLYAELMYEPWKYAAGLDAYAIHPSFVSLTPKVIEGCAANNIAINTWTVNKEEHMRILAEKEVDGIITNYPDKALKVVNSL